MLCLLCDSEGLVAFPEQGLCDCKQVISPCRREVVNVCAQTAQRVYCHGALLGAQALGVAHHRLHKSVLHSCGK